MIPSHVPTDPWWLGPLIVSFASLYIMLWIKRYRCVCIWINATFDLSRLGWMLSFTTPFSLPKWTTVTWFAWPSSLRCRLAPLCSRCPGQTASFSAPMPPPRPLNTLAQSSRRWSAVSWASYMTSWRRREMVSIRDATVLAIVPNRSVHPVRFGTSRWTAIFRYPRHQNVIPSTRVSHSAFLLRRPP